LICAAVGRGATLPVSRFAARIILWLTAAFLACVLVWPVFESIAGAFRRCEPGIPSLGYLAELFRNSIYLDGLRNALLMGLGSTALALVIALPLAWVADRCVFPFKRLLTTLALAPMVLPPFCRGYWSDCAVRSDGGG